MANLRFLADESCDARVARALRERGRDVASMAELARGAPDQEVIERACADERILLTEDRDFGQLVYAAGFALGVGVFYIRCPEQVRPTLPERIVAAMERVGDKLVGAFVVWTPHRMRLRRPSGGK